MALAAWSGRDDARSRLARDAVGSRREALGRVVAELVAPLAPTLSRRAREQLQEGARRARLDDVVQLLGLARVLALALGHDVDLAAAGGEGPVALAFDAEEDQLGDIAEVEADPAPVGTAVLARLVPNEIGLVRESPRVHDGHALGEQGVGHPQVEMRALGARVRDRQ